MENAEEIIREFHERAFGEEMARVNFLPREERWAYVRNLWARSRKLADGNGVKVLHGVDRVWDGDLEV